MRIIAIVFSLSCLFLNSQIYAADLLIRLTGVEVPEGNMRVALFNSKETFTESPVEAVSVPATEGTMQIELSELAAGEYAVMVFQDLDSNEELNTNLIGMPKEPWGGSLQGKSILGPPTWNDVKFTLQGDTTTITIELH